MSRLPDLPLVIRTFAQFQRHGFTVTAHWRCGHEAVLDLPELIKRQGSAAEPDYAFKAALVCRQCGAVGAGTSIAEQQKA